MILSASFAFKTIQTRGGAARKGIQPPAVAQKWDRRVVVGGLLGVKGVLGEGRVRGMAA